MGVIQPSLRDLDCCSTIPPLKGWAILEPPSGRKDLEASTGSTSASPKNVQTPGVAERRLNYVPQIAFNITTQISRRPLPKGELRIARQFTAGFESEIAQVPKGRLNPFMSYVSSYSHCVFSTKDRRPFLTAQLRDRLWPFLGGIAREHQMKALSIGGVEDHVHVLLSLPATMSIAKAMQLIKGGSSKWVHDSFPDQTSVRVAN